MRVALQSDNEVLVIRKLAEEVASTRRETVTTAHLLAAIASRTSPAADLLRDRRLDAEVLAKAARASTDDERDPIGHALRRAAQVARDSGAMEPSAIHLLVALLSQRKAAAFRALEQCGVDVARLRGAAIRIAGGFVEPRRVSSAPPAQVSRSAPPPASSAKPPLHRPPSILSPAVAVPVFPPVSKPTVALVEDKDAKKAAASHDAPLRRPRQEPSALPARRELRSSEHRLSDGRPRTRRSLNRDSSHVPSSVAEARFELDPQVFPTLCSIGNNLTCAAVQGTGRPVVGRKSEIEATLDILARHRANSACLIGVHGVGKPASLPGWLLTSPTTRRLALSMNGSLWNCPWRSFSGGTAPGVVAGRISTIAKEVRESKRQVVLFIDDIHQLISSDGFGEVACELERTMSTGQIPFIVATTPEDYRRTLEADAQLVRCFTPLEVVEPTQEQAVDMLLSASPALEKHHELPLASEAIQASVSWSVRYLPGRPLPEKALSILDLASARSRRRGRMDVSMEAVAEVVAEMAEMPKERLLESDRERMLQLEKLLSSRVVGHTHALERMAKILRRNAAGFRGGRPIGSFLLLGPTGVGKTESAKAIAEALFHAPDAMTRLDLSEFAEPHALARLIGAPPGYIGHEAGGQLTEAVRRRPYQVLLLDEIEKAHRDVLEAFLQVLDEGRMTDGRGRTVDFTNTVIVMTSNLGASEASQAINARGIGFGRSSKETQDRNVEEAVLGAARSALPPELYNRIDEVMAYAPLTRDDVREVARRLMKALSEKLRTTKGLNLQVNEDVFEVLLDQGGYDASLGARPMKRAIARLVEAPLADLILRDGVGTGQSIVLMVDKGQILLSAQA